MAKFHSIPTKRLAESITASDTSFSIRTNTDWNGVPLNPADFDGEEYGVFRNETNTKLEFFSYDVSDIGNGNLTILKRGLDYSGDLTTEVEDNKKNWIKGETLVELGSDPAQLFQWLKEYIDNGLNAGAADATETVKGIVEIATNAEIDAGTTAGSTGARLIVPADARNNLNNDEKDALAGTAGTPSEANKFVTNDDTTGTGEVTRSSEIKNFGTRVTAVSNGTPTQVTSDGFLFGYTRKTRSSSASGNQGNRYEAHVKVDDHENPSTLVAVIEQNTSGSSTGTDKNDQFMSFMVPISAGDYYTIEVVNNFNMVGTAAYFFMPING